MGLIAYDEATTPTASLTQAQVDRSRSTLDGDL
jgi:hypothetical protein